MTLVFIDVTQSRKYLNRSSTRVLINSIQQTPALKMNQAVITSDGSHRLSAILFESHNSYCTLRDNKV